MIGKTLLHYRIIEELGRGGMGVVYKAEDTKLKREVAIKFLPRHIAASKEERRRFKIEAQAAAALNHPNIATIHAIEEADEQMFIVMEFIEGKELREMINNPPVSPLSKGGNRGIMDIATQIAEGLQAAHAKGIVHRDIKSSNIMVTDDGKVKIMDFGLAKIGAGTQLTKNHSTLGTAAYMSPEQAKGETVDQRTDIWSFGVVLYEMLAGELPFKGEYEQAIIYSVLNEPPPPIKNIRNKPIESVLKKILEKNPDKRYSQMAEVISDFESILKGQVITETGSKITPIEIKKLAVLPFSNILDDPQTNFLGFALADQIIGAMAYSKNVLIRPSSSIRKFQNQAIDLQKAGTELNVNYVLAGNYLKEAETIRLNIELIDLESEKMIWRELIEIKYKNVFELQDTVSQKVVEAMKIQFSEEEREHMNPGTPQNPLAYEFYLRAVSYPHTLEASKIAIEMINNSIKLDANFAPAYLELGIRYHQLSQVGKGSLNAAEQSEKALLKALSLKSDFLPALAYLGLTYTDKGKHEEAHSLLIKALEINPNDAWLHFSLAYHYRYIGFLEESEKEIEKALSLDPENPRFRSAIITYMYLGKYDYAISSFTLDRESPFTLNLLGEIAFRKGDKELSHWYFEKSLQNKEEVGEFYFASAFVEYMKGNPEKVAEVNLKRELTNPADGEIWYEIARIYGLLKMKKDCQRALKKSIDMGFVCYPFMKTDVFLDSIRNDPEIRNLLDEARKNHEELKNKILVSNGQ